VQRYAEQVAHEIRFCECVGLWGRSGNNLALPDHSNARHIIARIDAKPPSGKAGSPWPRGMGKTRVVPAAVGLILAVTYRNAPSGDHIARQGLGQMTFQVRSCSDTATVPRLGPPMPDATTQAPPGIRHLFRRWFGPEHAPSPHHPS